jgi:hypothetical protein
VDFFLSFVDLSTFFMSGFQVQDEYTACSTGVLTINQFLNLLIIRIASEVQTSGRRTKGDTYPSTVPKKSIRPTVCRVAGIDFTFKKGANSRFSGPHDTL